MLVKGAYFLVLQCVAVCCSVLQCVVACCSVLHNEDDTRSPKVCAFGVAVCCSVLQRVAVCCTTRMMLVRLKCVLQCVAVCCSVLQCDAV